MKNILMGAGVVYLLIQSYTTVDNSLTKCWTTTTDGSVSVTCNGSAK